MNLVGITVANETLWAIVAILAIIALALWIFSHRRH